MYFVGWVGVSILTNAIWGIANPLLLSWNMPDVVIGLLKTFLTGGVFVMLSLLLFLALISALMNAFSGLTTAYVYELLSGLKKAENENIDFEIK